MRSPKRGDANRRDWKDEGGRLKDEFEWLSEMKASTSSGVGGSPVIARERRRIRVAGSASGEGVSPSARSFAKTKSSMPFRAQPLHSSFILPPSAFSFFGA